MAPSPPPMRSMVVGSGVMVPPANAGAARQSRAIPKDRRFCLIGVLLFLRNVADHQDGAKSSTDQKHGGGFWCDGYAGKRGGGKAEKSDS